MEIIPISSPDAKEKLFSEFDPRTTIWVVPDLVSRSALQEKLLQKFDVVENNACLRISDLWRQLFFRVRPDFRVVSPAYAKALVREWLKTSEFEWARTPGASENIVHYLNELIPLISHPESETLMPQWFQENQGAFVRWGLWYVEAVRLWKRFYAEKIVARNWISGFLVNEPGFEKQLSRPLIFDLGVEILAPELELMRQMSRFVEVKILVPSPEWAGEYPALTNLIPCEEVKRWQGGKTDFRHFASSLGEIKDSVATVRQWIEEGVEPEKIAIVAPNRKRVWSTLVEFLRFEGIRVQENEPDPVSAYGRIGQLISRLQNNFGHIESSHIELDLFHSSEVERKLINHEEFYRLFNNIYSDRDLRRHAEIKREYEARAEISQAWNTNEFINKVSAQWNDDWPHETLEKLLNEVVKDSHPGIPLEPRNWLSYFGELAGTVDLNSSQGNVSGVRVENYFSADHLNISHLYFLNATEAEFKKNRRTSILDEDLKSLSRALGFNLTVNAPDIPEFIAKWLLSRNFKASVLSFADSDFSGREETPAFFWLQGCLARGQETKILVPGMTVWDQKQESLAKNPESTEVGKRVRAEFEKPATSIGPWHKPLKISATSLANYNRCPYVYYAENLLGMKVSEPLDLDLGYMDLGQLLHFLTEKIISENRGFDLSESEISKIIDSWARESAVPLVDSDLWQHQKVRLYPYVKKFLETESEWRRRFPQTKTAAVELEIKGEINTPLGVVKITGRIDRVDHDGEGRYLVIDYKRSDSNLSALKSWLKNQLYQPLLYTLAIEKGWTRLGRQKVVGGQFYVLRDGDRTRAFFVKEESGTLFDSDSRERNKISNAEKEELIGELEKVISDSVTRVLGGEFLPKPVDEEQTCNDCRWRYSCRARHLM